MKVTRHNVLRTSTLDYPRKLALYRACKWEAPPPPVYTGQWDDRAWVDYITSYGYWLK